MVSKEIVEALSVITEEERAFLNGCKKIDRSLYMDDSCNRISSHKLLDPEKLITVRPHTRFVHFPEHTHDFVEIVYMVRGITTHIINGTTLTLHPGELLMMGQHTRQEILKAGQEDLAVNFIIRPEFFRATLPYMGDSETPLRRFIVDCLCGGSESNFLYFRVADILPIQHLLENLLWTMVTETKNRRELNQLTFSLLFVLLINHTDCLYYTTAEEETIFSVLRYIEEHYSDGSLAKIAEQLHYDAAALSREIKRRTGKSYTELLQDKRMSQAAWLLRNTRNRVDQIARIVGYENIGYFYRLFSSHLGMSPKKYRDCK